MSELTLKAVDDYLDSNYKMIRKEVWSGYIRTAILIGAGIGISTIGGAITGAWGAAKAASDTTTAVVATEQIESMKERATDMIAEIDRIRSATRLVDLTPRIQKLEALSVQKGEVISFQSSTEGRFVRQYGGACWIDSASDGDPRNDGRQFLPTDFQFLVTDPVH